MIEFPEFVLASRSPQRCQLLRQAGYKFQVIKPPLPEPQETSAHSAPAQLAEALAYFKVRAVRRQNHDAIILGADTVVARAGQVFGKPDNEQHARAMLSALSGSRHAVITGLAILLPAPDLPPRTRERLLASETTYVTMRTWRREEIERYIASGEWRDKAGAYAIQESADAFVEKIEGSFSNVVGLPMELLERMFNQVRRCLTTKAT